MVILIDQWRLIALEIVIWLEILNEQQHSRDWHH
jgi:hypothetical protein